MANVQDAWACATRAIGCAGRTGKMDRLDLVDMAKGLRSLAPLGLLGLQLAGQMSLDRERS